MVRGNEWWWVALQSCLSQIKWKWALPRFGIHILYISLRCSFEQICDHTVRVHAGCALHVTHHTMHIDKISTAWKQTWCCYIYCWTDKSIQREKGRKKEIEKDKGVSCYCFSEPFSFNSTITCPLHVTVQRWQIIVCVTWPSEMICIVEIA